MRIRRSPLLLSGLALLMGASPAPAQADGAARAVEGAASKIDKALGPQGGMPPDVQAIMKKAASGARLTPEEKQKLLVFNRAAKQSIQKPKALGLCPGTETASAGTISDRPPHRDAYLVQVKGAINLYGARIGEARGKIDSIVQRARRQEDISNLGAVFLTMGAGSAAVYAAAKGALLMPDDALAANNLGAALKAMKDMPRALQALLYAHALKRDLAIATTNLGWVYYDLGDSARAEALFGEALAATPHFTGAEEGLGLLAECAENHKTAAKHLRSSMDGTYSFTCAGALKQADAGAKANGDPDNGARPISEPGGQPADSGGEAAAGLELPDPPLGETPAEAKAAATVLSKMFLEAFNQEKEELDRQLAMVGAFQKAHHDSYAAHVDGNTLVQPISDEKETFLLADLERIFILEKARKANAKFLEQWTKVSMDLFQRMAEVAKDCGGDEYRCCLRRKELAQTIFPALLNAWGPCWREVKPALVDYYGATSPVLARIVDPVQNRYFNGKRRLVVLHEYQTALNVLMQGSALVAGLWEGKCVPPPPRAPAAKKAKVSDTDPSCPFKNPIALKLIILEVTLDCEQKKLKIEVGEGVMVALERDFKHGRTTVFVGAGINTDSIPFSPFGVEGKTGFFMTTEGDSVKDFGMTSTASETAFWTKSEVESRWGILEGPELTVEHSVAFAGR